VTGLRPNTSHLFYLEGIDKTANCKQVGKVLGAGLQADENGVLEFQFYYYPTIETTNVTTEAAAVTEMVAASKAISVTNSDGTSSATSVLQVSNYIKKVFTAPPEPAVIFVPGGGGSDDTLTVAQETDNIVVGGSSGRFHTFEDFRQV
jgi:hypothetical protein